MIIYIHSYYNTPYSSINCYKTMNKILLLEQIGAFGTGNKSGYYPQDVINIIKEFAFHDISTMEYANKVSRYKHNLNSYMIKNVNTECESNEIQVVETTPDARIDFHYTWNDEDSNSHHSVVCSICGNFVICGNLNVNHHSTHIRCGCDDDFDDLESEYDDNYDYDYDSD